MNKYATDLMLEQAKSHQVALIYPDGCSIWHKKCKVIYNSTQNGIRLYRLVNAHPVPLLYGIRKPGDFIRSEISIDSLDCFYNEFKPEVVHLHTLMGLPQGVLAFFKEKGVKVVFTSHDYFGICPRVNFINNQGVLCDGANPEKCARCNENAPTTLFLRIRNSALVLKSRDFLRWLKNIRSC
ncbi:MAG: glycosyltransferase [Bacteroidaceae bacterium]|nr:glycosyltransferase [Bacteroidaceae bacterium]